LVDTLLDCLSKPLTLMNDFEVVPEPLEVSWIQVNNTLLCPRYLWFQQPTSSWLWTKGSQIRISLWAISCRDCQEREDQKKSRLFCWIDVWTKWTLFCLSKVSRRRKN
jgi:hypothetical protein